MTIFVAVGWVGDMYAPIAIGVGAVVCIAAAIAGATSQDLKTGFLVGATPSSQQIGLVVGVVTSAFVIGITTLYLHDVMTIGSDSLPAPQATLMSTIIRGLLSHNLPWGLVLVGVFISVTLDLCGIGRCRSPSVLSADSTPRRSSWAASCAGGSSVRRATAKNPRSAAARCLVPD